jgi:hypothetical protein
LASWAIFLMLSEVRAFPTVRFSFMSIGDLNRWWDRRNDATHPDRQISRKNAEEFVGQVSELASRLLQG